MEDCFSRAKVSHKPTPTRYTFIPKFFFCLVDVLLGPVEHDGDVPAPLPVVDGKQGAPLLKITLFSLAILSVPMFTNFEKITSKRIDYTYFKGHICTFQVQRWLGHEDLLLDCREHLFQCHTDAVHFPPNLPPPHTSQMELDQNQIEHDRTRLNWTELQ